MGFRSRPADPAPECPPAGPIHPQRHGASHQRAEGWIAGVDAPGTEAAPESPCGGLWGLLEGDPQQPPPEGSAAGIVRQGRFQLGCLLRVEAWRSGTGGTHFWVVAVDPMLPPVSGPHVAPHQGR